MIKFKCDKDELEFQNIIKYVNTIGSTKLAESEIVDIKKLLLNIDKEEEKFSSCITTKNCSLEILTVAIGYIERMGIYDNTIFSLVWCCCIMAHKFLSDDPLFTLILANMGGIESDEYNLIERTVFKKLDYTLSTCQKRYSKLLNIRKYT